MMDGWMATGTEQRKRGKIDELLLCDPLGASQNKYTISLDVSSIDDAKHQKTRLSICLYKGTKEMYTLQMHSTNLGIRRQCGQD